VVVDRLRVGAELMEVAAGVVHDWMRPMTEGHLWRQPTDEDGGELGASLIFGRGQQLKDLLGSTQLRGA
jgi:hypothetical protein